MEPRLSFIIYQESKKRKNRANFIRKYIKYFINFLKNVKFIAVHNVIHKTFAGFGCPKVVCSRDGARDFFVIHRWIMHCLPRALIQDSLISSISRDTLSTNKTNEKENFDDWYIIKYIEFTEINLSSEHAKIPYLQKII